uniref:Double jelly roll-like domain-containing protein n=1 Tax=Cacopsylla melanoneura TaxID=428564 RepID=A0A8D8QQ76_9HEMI
MNTNNVLDINRPVSFDEKITRYEIHSYSPATSISLDSTDNVIININQESAYLLISESGIYLEGQFKKSDGNNLDANSAIDFANNGLCFLFNEIRLEMNSIEIDSSKHCGLSSALKGYPSFSPSESKKYEVCGWNSNKLLNKTDFTFSGFIPLKFILGFAESYDKIILNQRLDLIISRENNCKNALISTTVNDVKVQFSKILWKVPHIQVNDSLRLELLTKYKQNIPITIGFKKWSLSYYPQIPITAENSWSIKCSNQLEKPRYIIFGFQSSRENDLTKDPSKFDHVNLKNLKVFLNSEVYPYEDLNLDIEKQRYLMLYLMYCSFQESFYDKVSEPLLGYTEFKDTAPLCIIDTSRQSELWKHSSTVDIRVEYEMKNAPPADTTLYALIIHDILFKLYPLTNIVQKIM